MSKILSIVHLIYGSRNIFTPYATTNPTQGIQSTLHIIHTKGKTENTMEIIHFKRGKLLNSLEKCYISK
jgi:hypothetical protein